MRAVSDAGPLIHLSWIDQLALLDRLFEEVIVPPAVRDEVLASPAGTLGLDRILITDDAPARAEAARRGLGVVGTVGVLTQARDQGLIATALPLLLELRRLGQWMSEALLQTVREEEARRPS